MTETVNEFADAAAQVMGQQTAAIRTNVYNAVNQNPATVAQHSQLASQLGVPLESVQSDPETARQQVALQQVDAHKITTQYPHLAQFLSDPVFGATNTAKAQNDLQTLAATEQSIKQMPQPPAASAPPNLESDKPGLLGDVWTGLKSSGQKIFGAWDKAAVALSDAMPDGMPGKMSPEDRAAYLARGENMIATGNAQPPQRWTGQVAGALGYLPFLEAAPFVMGGTEGVSASQQLQSQGVDAGTANQAGALQGAVMGAANFIPMGDLAFKSGVVPFVKSLFGATVKAGVSGAAQEVAGDSGAAGILRANGFGGIADQYGPTIDKAWDGALFMAAMHTGMQVTTHGVPALFANGKPPVPTGIVEDTARAADATQGMAGLQALGELAGKSELRKNDPQAFHDFVQKVTDDGHLPEVWVEGKTLVDALNQSGISPDELSAKLPGVSAQITEAIHTGGDVRIPTADYATSIAGTALDQALLPHLKVDPEGMTYAQGQEHLANQQAEMVNQAKSVTDEAAAKSERDNQLKGITDDIQQQLMATGRFPADVAKQYAALHGAFYDNMSERMGISPQEMRERMPLSIKGEGAGGLSQEGEPHTKITGTEFGGADTPVKALRSAAKAWYEKNLRGTSVTNEASGKEIKFANARKGFSTSADPEKVRLFAALPELLRKGAIENSNAPIDKNAEPDTRAYHWLEGNVDVGGRITRVGVTLREDGNGNIYYNHNPIEKGPDLPVSRTDPAHKAGGFPQKDETLKQTVAPTDGDVNLHVLEQGAGNRGSYDPATGQLGLLKDADLSTFLHESGHHFLEAFHDLAQHPEAPEGIKADFDTLLKSFKVEGDTPEERMANWSGRDLNAKREGHEQFAEGFEQYLMTGKAPVPELQSMFSRFRSWLMSVYQSMRGEVSPEVRDVMDRMFASQEAIKDAERVRAYAIPDLAAEHGEMIDQYKELGKEATEQAIAEMQARSLRDMQLTSNRLENAKRGLRRDAREKYNAIRDEVTKEVDESPAMKAKADLDEMRKAGSVDPELIAERHGFTNSDEMIKAIDAFGDKADAIKGLTDQRMLERHGELVDPVSIQRAAEAAIHNETRSLMMATGLKMFTKSPMSANAINKAAKAAADTAINAKKVGELRPAQYSAAEAKANKAMLKLAPKDPAGAAQAQRAALLNNRLFKSATEAVDDVRKIVSYMKRFDKVSTLKRINVEERDQILNLLKNFDFRLNPSDKPTRAQQNLQQWLESQQMAGYTPDIDPATLQARPRTEYREMTVEALRGLYDSVRSMEEIGKNKLMADWQGQRIELHDLVHQQFIPKMQERENKFNSDELHNRPENRDAGKVQLALDKMGSFLRAGMADLKPQYFKSNHFDSHEILGPFHELFNQVFNANYKKIDMTVEQSKFARDLAQRLGKDWQKSIYDMVPNNTLIDAKASEENGGRQVPMRLTRDNMIQMAAHAGNESNFDKLAKGYGWKPEDVWGFLDGRLTKQDAQAVKAQWEMANAHWPEVKAMYERMGQVVPPKVEPRPYKLRLADGTVEDMPGGYMPIRYDPLRSRLGEKKQAERSIDPESGRFGYDFFGRDTTTNGSMNARSDGYTDAIDLTHNVLERAMAETIHDLAYREPLVNVNKIITHPDFRAQFKRTYGQEDYDALHTWLGRIANSENMDRQVGSLGTVLRYTRTGMVMNAIALRASTVLKHGGSAAIKTTGYFAGGGEKYYLARQAAMATDYKAQLSEAQDKFPEIRARMTQQDRDYRQTVSSLYTPDSPHGKAERFGHAAVAWADLFTAVATAHGAYDRAITEGIPESMGGTGQPMTHDQAVSYANQIVREAHGSQIESARSNVMTNPHEGVKMFTTLYGFMNNTLGQTSDMISKLNTAGISNPQVLARSMMALVVPALWAGVLTDGWPTGDDWKGWLAKSLGSETLGMVPFARDAYSFLEGYKHAGVMGAESWMQSVLQPVLDANKAAQGKAVPGAISHLADAVGMGLHIPGLGQLGKTAQYIYDTQTGRQNPKDAIEALQGATIGIHKAK